MLLLLNFRALYIHIYVGTYVFLKIELWKTKPIAKAYILDKIRTRNFVNRSSHSFNFSIACYCMQFMELQIHLCDAYTTQSYVARTTYQQSWTKQDGYTYTWQPQSAPHYSLCDHIMHLGNWGQPAKSKREDQKVPPLRKHQCMKAILNKV